MANVVEGEEWRGMGAGTERGEGAREVYDPARWDALVACAKARIPEVRGRDVELRVVTREGAPPSFAEASDGALRSLGEGRARARLPVEVVQTGHAFSFGDNLWPLDTMRRFGQAETDRAKYWKMRFADCLNAANALCYWTERPRNDGPKIEDRQGENVTDGFAYCVEWAASRGLTVKGHPLFWSIEKAVPEWVKRYDYQTQLKFAEVRVRNLVARFRGRVAIWDAVNEACWEPAFRNLPDRHWPHLDPIDEIADYVEPVLRWAREEDPDACLLLNDYGMQEGRLDAPPRAADGTEVTAAMQRKRYLALITELFDRGCPPDAVGLQSHTGGFTPHEAQLAVYDEMAASGLPVHVTEFWPPTRELTRGGLPPDEIEAVKAEYVANYLTCAFAHPAVEAFFFWGFMRWAVKWHERTSAHEILPVYERVRDLIRSEWTTREELVTDADGCVKFRGFLGDYSLRYALPAGATPRGGAKKGARFTVARGDAMPLTVTAS